MTPWSGKGLHQFDLSVDERLDLRLPDREDPEKRLSTEHGHGQDRAEIEELLPVIRRLEPRLGEHVRRVNDATLERGPPRHGAGADHKRTLPEVILGARFNAVRRRIPEGLALNRVHLTAIGSTKPGGILNEGLQHRLQIKRRPADHLQDFTGGGLLVEGFREIAIARLQLREQPHILDRDHGLVGEGFDEFDLLVGEWLDYAPAHQDETDRTPVAQQRYAQMGTIAGQTLWLKVAVFRVG